MFISTAVEMPTSSDVTKRREGHTGRLQRNQSQLYSSVEARRTSGTVSTRLSSLHLSCIQSLATIYAQPQLRQIFCAYLAGGNGAPDLEPYRTRRVDGLETHRKGIDERSAAVVAKTKTELREWISSCFTRVEDVAYVGLGLILAVSALVLLVIVALSLGQAIMSANLPQKNC